MGIGGAILLGDNWRVLDPIAAVIVSILIVKVAFQLVVPAINDLLEKSLPGEVEDEILSIINETPEVRNPHNLCTRRIGNDFAIEVHIRVDGQITVSRAHELTKEIENKLRLKFGPTTHIILHVEPIKEKKMSELTLYKGEVFDFIDSPLNRKDAYRYFPMGHWSYRMEK